MHKHNSRHNSHPAEPTNAEIAKLAYSFFEAAGRLEGHDLEHWLRAKEQLSKERSSRITSQKVTKIEARLNNSGPQKASAVHIPSERGEDRYARTFAGRGHADYLQTGNIE